MPKHLSPTLLAAAAALLLAVAPASAKLDRDLIKSERAACRETVEGKVDKPKQVCECMAEGLDEAMDDDAYAALARLVNLGEESEAGLAARETARAVVAQCLAG